MLNQKLNETLNRHAERSRERAAATDAARESAAKARQGVIFLGNILLFLGYISLAIALGVYGVLNLPAVLATIFICIAAHILIAVRAWEG